MKKSRAIELLGGTPTAAAEAIGVSHSAVSQWPEDLPPRITDRVQAALARKHLPAELIGADDSAATAAADAAAQAAPTGA